MPYRSINKSIKISSVSIIFTFASVLR